MPPRGVKSAKRSRQYEHIKESATKRGRSPRRAKQIAAATVNKQRRKSGETRTSGTGSRTRTTKTSRGSRNRTPSTRGPRTRSGSRS